MGRKESNQTNKQTHKQTSTSLRLTMNYEKLYLTFSNQGLMRLQIQWCFCKSTIYFIGQPSTRVTDQSNRRKVSLSNKSELQKFGYRRCSKMSSKGCLQKGLDKQRRPRSNCFLRVFPVCYSDKHCMNSVHPC